MHAIGNTNKCSNHALASVTCTSTNSSNTFLNKPIATENTYISVYGRKMRTSSPLSGVHWQQRFLMPLSGVHWQQRFRLSSGSSSRASNPCKSNWIRRKDCFCCFCNSSYTCASKSSPQTPPRPRASQKEPGWPALWTTSIDKLSGEGSLAGTWRRCRPTVNLVNASTTDSPGKKWAKRRKFDRMRMTPRASARLGRRAMFNYKKEIQI